MSGSVKIKNWEDRQSQRKDVTGPGPWIKVYKTLLTNPKTVMLSDAELGRLVKIWLLAAMELDTWGEVPADPSLLCRIGMMDENPDLQLLSTLGLIESVNGSLTSRERDVNDPLPQGKVRQGKVRQGKPPLPPKGGTVRVPYSRIMENLNLQLGKGYKTDPVSKRFQKMIRARWGEGFKEEDFALVVATKKKQWEGADKTQGWLRPDTLFTGKFESYLQEAKVDDGYDDLRKEFG